MTPRQTLNHVGRSGGTLAVDSDERLRVLPDFVPSPAGWTVFTSSLLWNLARHAFGVEVSQAFAAGSLTDEQATAFSDFLTWAARYSTAESAGVRNERA